ncbi:sensor histidine kinase [Streptomyces jumonjinensis]|uniref:sensor histidine kinase n=1 Tax=Streptomyces jumonjinensis TaxID=1945 RepID=UPI00378E3DC0
MNVVSRILAGLRAGWEWLAVAEPRPGDQRPPVLPRRGPGVELVLALVLALVAAGTEELMGSAGHRVLVAGVGAAVLSLLRRRLPIPVLIVVCGLMSWLGGFFALQIVAGWSAGRRIVGFSRALVAFTGAYIAYAVGSVLIARAEDSRLTLMMSLVLTLVFLAMVVIPGLVSRYWSQRQTLLHALQERNAQLLWESRMVAGQARLMERQRIAQDMHDSLGHQLALIAVHTGALEVDPELTGRQREAVGVLRNASVTAMHELREVVGILRDGVEAPSAPMVDETGRAARGTAGIESLTDAARAAGNTVELRCTGEARPLAPAADHAAYRIVQEALTNAYKHAPGTPIGVELRYEPDSFVVEIVSGAATVGKGEVVSGGQGLTGLRERARLVGGMVHAGVVDGGGFRVAGVLPYGTGEAAPVAAPAGDLPRQSYGAAGAYGPPAMDWSAPGRTATMGELDASRRRSRAGGVGLGCAIAAGTLLLVVAAVVAGLFFLVDSVDEGMIDQDEYQRVKIGESEDGVRDRLPGGDTVFISGLSGKGPKEPEGSECLVLMSSEISDSFESEPVFRFCFRDGKLIEKKSYEVKR